MMSARRAFLALLLAGLIFPGVAWSVDEKKDEKTEKKDTDWKKGTVVGLLTAKGDNWIEIKADGEEKARKYVPHWRGGLPKDGGGPDKKMLATFKTLKIGSRLRIEWVFEERARVEKIEVLKEPKKEADKKK
jgi:hypothetical protein